MLDPLAGFDTAVRSHHDAGVPLPGFCTVEDALAAIARGEMVVVVDGEDRENEGDLILAATLATQEQLAFLIRHTSGVVCVAAPESRLDELQLPLMVAEEANVEAMRTAFTVSVDARVGVTTGISASDRALTIRALADADTVPSDLSRPGHVFPLRARSGGVLTRAGHTEAAVDLMRLAGLPEFGVLAEVTRDDGSMARTDDLIAFCADHGLLMLSIADLVSWRLHRERHVVHESSARLPTDLGTFEVHAFTSQLDGQQHVALTIGDVRAEDGVLVRVHSECLTGDIFGSRRCDCGHQLTSALARIAHEGTGVLVYLRGHEGRGIGMAHKLRAYTLQDQGADTVDANLALGLPVDSREYGVGAQILVALGVRRMRLMTNNPEKYQGLAGYGLDIVERVPAPPLVTPENIRYLRTKVDRMHHVLDLGDQFG